MVFLIVRFIEFTYHRRQLRTSGGSLPFFLNVKMFTACFPTILTGANEETKKKVWIGCTVFG